MTVNFVVYQVAVAMFGYMTEIDTVEMTDVQEIEADGKFWYNDIFFASHSTRPKHKAKHYVTIFTAPLR